MIINSSPLLDEVFLKKLFSINHREVYAKIESLDWDENIIEEITGVVTQGSVNVDGNSAVRRTCSLSMVVKDEEKKDINWALETKFRLYCGLINEVDMKYPNLIWFPQGLFLITSFSKSHATNNFTISINGKDKMALLDGSLGGAITANSVDFGTVETKDLATETITIEKLKLKDIIREAVHEYAREPFHNIIIQDLDKDGLELLEYRGTDPIYLLNRTSSNKIYNIYLNGNSKVYLTDSTSIPMNSDSIVYDTRISSLTDKVDPPTQVYIEDPRRYNNKELEDNAYTIIKMEYGDSAGYRLTDLVYAGDLIANVGSSITSGVLDKIKQMLGEYEYFYDVYGKFIFRKKAVYINTSWTPIEGTYVENNMYKFPYEYSLENHEVISAFTNNPDISNVKNDFSIWGTKTSITGQELPVHLRLAIDKKPIEYTTYDGMTYLAGDDFKTNLFYKVKINALARTKYLEMCDEIFEKEYKNLYPTFSESDINDKISADYRFYYYEKNQGSNNYIIICPQIKPGDITANGEIGYSISWSLPDALNNTYKYCDVQCDWREIIYQMALDYRKNYHNDDFLVEIARRNPIYYPTGYTGYELYYTDIISFWRQLYNPQAVWEPSETRTLGEIVSSDLVANNGDKWPDVRGLNTMQKLEKIDDKSVEDLYIKLSQEDLENLTYVSNFSYKTSGGLGHILIKDKNMQLSKSSGTSFSTPTEFQLIKNDNNLEESWVTYGYTYTGSAGRLYLIAEESKIYNKSNRKYLILANLSIVDAKNKSKKQTFYIGINQSYLELSIEAKSGSRLYFNTADLTLLKKESNNNFTSIERAILDDGFGSEVYIQYNTIFEPDEKTFVLDYVYFKDLNLQLNYNIEYSAEEGSTDSLRVYANVYNGLNLWSDIYNKKDGSGQIMYEMYYKDYNNKFQLIRKSVERTLTWTHENGGAKTEIVKGGKMSISYYKYAVEPYSISVLGLLEDGKKIIIKTISINKKNLGVVDNPLITETFSYNGDMQVSATTEIPKCTVVGVVQERFSDNDSDKEKFIDYLLKNDLKKDNLYWSLCTDKEEDKIIYPVKECLPIISNNNQTYYCLETNLWKDLEKNRDYIIEDGMISPFESYFTLEFDDYGNWKGGSFIPLEPKLRIARYNEVDEFHVNYQSLTYGWHINVVDNPAQLNFWFDFIDSGEIEKFSTYNIGNRPKATNDNKVKAIYFKEVPNIIYLSQDQSSEDLSDDWSGYTTLNIPDSLTEMFSISSQGKSAKDVLDEYLYNHTYAIENVSITAMPIYTLQPNTRIKITNEKEKINGEYVISKLTVPLTYNGVMSITANKLAESIL